MAVVSIGRCFRCLFRSAVKILAGELVSVSAPKNMYYQHIPDMRRPPSLFGHIRDGQIEYYQNIIMAIVLDTYSATGISDKLIISGLNHSLIWHVRLIWHARWQCD